jgi:fatty acid desaturase
VNKALTYLGFPFFVQLSATYWWNKHLIAHHPAPNVYGADQDVDLWPFFSITKEQVEQRSGIRRLYLKVQWLVIPVALAANAFSMQVQGWRYVLRALCDGDRRGTQHWMDVGAMLCHWLAWIAVPSMFLPVSHVLELYVLRMICLGYALFFVLAPAHFPAEAICVEQGTHTRDFVMSQTAATVNFRTRLLGRMLCSGLEYQIEHHLFPGMSHVHYPKVSALVKQFCESNGYPYRTLGWGEAIWKCLLVFRTPKSVEPSFDVFQLGGRANGSR